MTSAAVLFVPLVIREKDMEDVVSGITLRVRLLFMLAVNREIPSPATIVNVVSLLSAIIVFWPLTAIFLNIFCVEPLSVFSNFTPSILKPAPAVKVTSPDVPWNEVTPPLLIVSPLIWIALPACNTSLPIKPWRLDTPLWLLAVAAFSVVGIGE